MRSECRAKITFTYIALCMAIILAQAQFAASQEPAPNAKPKMDQRGGFVPMRMDSRAQDRTYHFSETNEDLHYCLFVSSKVSKDRKALLI